MTIIAQEVTLSIVQDWLINKVASLTNRCPLDIQLDTPIADYGLDSLHAVGLSGDIEDWLGMVIEPTVSWDYPTIQAMAQYLCTAFTETVKENGLNQKVA